MKGIRNLELFEMVVFIVSEMYFKLFFVVDGLICCVFFFFVYLFLWIMLWVICLNENVILDDVIKDFDVFDLFIFCGYVDLILIFYIILNIFL